MSKVHNFHPTDEDREHVCEWLAGGLSRADVAKALGLNQRSLRRHFSAELATGAARKRAELVSALFASARAGNASAAECLRKLSQSEKPGRRVVERTERALGKKAQAARDAETAGIGTDWEDLLTPPGFIQ